MNETDFIRQQLATERAHLRAILAGVARGSGAANRARPVTTYIGWVSQRLRAQLLAHRRALGVPADAHVETEPLALLEQLEALDAQAGQALRTVHWRRAAQLSADAILEERQLYAAARVAVGQE